MTADSKQDAQQKPGKVRTEFPIGVKVLLVALLVVAGFGIYMVNRVSGKGTSGTNSSAIEQLIPNRNDMIQRQEPIGVDLASGYDVQLVLNGVLIPEDEVVRLAGVDIVQFLPGPGKTVEEYQTGENCVVATYWRYETGREQNATVSWCFTVV